MERRRIRVLNVCELCGAADETEAHLFFNCEFSRVFWFGTSLQIDMGSLGSKEFMVGWKKLLDRVGLGMNEDSVLQQIAFGHDVSGNVGMKLCLTRQVTEFNAATVEDDGAGDRRRRQEEAGKKIQIEGVVNGWRKPDFGSLKLNCDEAWRKESRICGVGWVLRHFAGIPKMAGGKGGDRYLSPVMAEVVVIRQGLKMCVQSGLSESGGARSGNRFEGADSNAQ
ncbi:uncharacterized protein [Malus domestica]|uniref:uncharacterized protein n=1 Tax=Malus domestica TaxID=3750 RepID=UPI003975F192